MKRIALVLVVQAAIAGAAVAKPVTHRALAGRYLRDDNARALPQFRARTIGVARTPIVHSPGVSVWPMLVEGKQNGLGVAVRDVPGGAPILGLVRIAAAKPGDGQIGQVDGMLGHLEPNVVHLTAGATDAGLVLRVPRGTLVMPRSNLEIAGTGSFRRSATYLLVSDVKGSGYYQALVTILNPERTKLSTGVFALGATRP